MSIINSQPLIGASGQGGYFLSKSLRFRSSASAYLNRTFGTPTLSTKWTWSGWLKFGYGSSYYTIFDGGSPDTRFGRDPSTNQLYVNNDTTNYIITTPVYRDYSAWYHAVLAFDSSQGTASNRLRLYINGSEVTAFATDNRSSISGAIGINTATAHGIGRQPSGGSAYFDGYMTEINFIDGQQLTPSSFGQTSSTTGVWQPIKYTGTYGTNGFYLPFTNTTSTTTLGNDFSGNGNNWTTNNISLTSGSTYDSMNDVPTNTNSNTANYAVMNPLNKASLVTVTDGNLTLSPSSASWGAISGTVAVTSGKWYYEYSASISSALTMCGWATTDEDVNTTYGSAVTKQWVMYLANGNKYGNGSNAVSYASSVSANTVVGVALDMDAGTLTFYIGGVSQGTAFSTGLSGKTLVPWIPVNSGAGAFSGYANFGQRPFAYTPPTGFVALNTFNLPTPTIGATASTQAGKYFGINLWTGNGSTGSRAITGLGFKPDWVWWKNRTTAKWHQVFDSNRGADKALSTNATDAEDASGGYGGEGSVTSFDTDGYTLQGGVGNNENGSAIVGWAWQAGQGTNATNTAGSITSTVSANTTAGFSIVTYTGTGANATVGHGLGVAPSMIICKSRDVAGNSWATYHVSLGNTKAIYLNLTNAPDTNSGFWNNTSPTSTVFSVGTLGDTNQNTKLQLAYCFAQVAGYSAFGSYTGNGSSDGTFVYTGFRPKWLMIKVTNTTDNWYLIDTVRQTYNVIGSTLSPNLSNAEFDLTIADMLSNGFKIRNSASVLNGNGNTVIYAAFAETPFKYSLGR